MNLKKIFVILFLFLLHLLPSEVLGEEVKIDNIVVQGNLRVSVPTILSYAEIEVGDIYTPEVSKNIIKKLYATKYFDDIAVLLEFNNLIIRVVEKPIITEIKLTGNNIIESEDIMNALDNVGIARSRPFDKNVFDKVEQELLRIYYDYGRYSITIKSAVKELENQLISLELDIDEGDPSTIKDITIIGNKDFSYDQIISLMDSGTKYWFEFWSSRDTYSKTVLESDLDKIRDFYLNRGYIRFEITSNQVNLSNNNKDIYVSISIKEGDIYEFGDITLFGNTAVSEQKIKDTILSLIKPGNKFSREIVELSKNSISFVLGDSGYAFPDIITIPKIDDDTKIVDVEFRVNPGQQTMVRRINIRGNEKTNDEVYRREIRQFESSLHSNSKIERSKVRLQRLKYVKNVQINKSPVEGRNDQVDVTFNIEETTSGEFKVGAGWSDTNGALFNVKVQQDNFLGKGNNVSLEAAKSQVTTSFKLINTNPYFTPDGVSKSVNLIYSETDVSSTSTASYVADTFGGGVFYVSPVSETDSFGFGYDILFTQYTKTIGSPIIVTHHLGDHGDTSFGISAKTNYRSDTRDRTVFATRGKDHLYSLEAFFPVDGASYFTASYKGEYNFPYVFPTFGLFDWNTVFRIKPTIGIGAGLFGTTSVPFHSKFFAGGVKSVRGFDGASLGPLTYEGTGPLSCTAKTCDAVGGDFVTISQFDWIFPPPPVLAQDQRNIRVSLFMDIGNVFEDVNDFEYNELRASYGIQGTFLTPIGNVTVGFVNAFKKKDGDDTQPVVFSLGGSF